MGIIDNASIVTSPTDNSPPALVGNDRFGAAMINTNASNGVALTYYPTAATTGTNQLRAFRVPGATCNASAASLTDQCFVSAATTGSTFVAGSENFGVQIACVADQSATGTTSNLGKNGAGAYTSGSGSGGSFNTAYSNTDNSITDTAGRDCENADLGVKFAWGYLRYSSAIN